VQLELTIRERAGDIYVHPGAHASAIDLHTLEQVRSCESETPTLFAAATAVAGGAARSFVERFADALAREPDRDERAMGRVWTALAPVFRADSGVNATLVLAVRERLVALQTGELTCALHVSSSGAVMLASPISPLEGSIAAMYGGAPLPQASDTGFLVRALGLHPQPVVAITVGRCAPDDLVLLGTCSLVGVFARELGRGADALQALATAEGEHPSDEHLAGVLARPLSSRAE